MFIVKKEFKYKSKFLKFECSTEYHDAQTWCVEHFGIQGDTWNIIYFPDLFGEHVAQFVFKENNDFCLFSLRWC
jgi:hypothetical protein